MTMYQFNNGAKFNQLGTVKYNSTVLAGIKQIFTRIGPRPVILDQNKNAVAVLENSYDIVLEQEINGMDELTFNFPITDDKIQYVQNENLVQMFETLYIIREVIKKKGGSEPSIEVHCEALWYDIQFSDPLDKVEWVETDANTMLNDILVGTGWTIGKIDMTTKRTVRLNAEEDNRLTAINAVHGVFGGDLVFDTDAKKVSLINPNLIHSGIAIVYQKNMSEIEAHYDTKDLVTRLFIYGKNGLTIGAANNDVLYLENYQFTNKKRVRVLKDERFTNPFHLMEYGQEQLDILSKPIMSYKATAQDLSNLTGYEHEKFSLGIVVRVMDKDLGIDSDVRIMKWKYPVESPWETVVELESKIKGLSDLLSGTEADGGGFGSEEAVEKADMLELMVFNYLLNSRADDGFSYWNNNGWEVDAINGYSGPASFKVTGQTGVTKNIRQTVFPSHRENYSLSFRAVTENLVSGPNGKVGVNVKITYEDGTNETQFISLV